MYRKFNRILNILAAFDREDFDESALAYWLELYVDRAAVVPGPSRNQTVVGMPAVVL